MPENKKERVLHGEITVTSSSDEAIEATIAQLSSEIKGLNNPEVVVEGEPLAPISITPPIASGDTLTSEKQPVDIESLRPTNSALGNLIRRKRLDKKAA